MSANHPTKTIAELDAGTPTSDDLLVFWESTSGTTNRATIASVVALTSGSVTSVDGRAGVVTLGDLYAPLSHTHVIADTADLQSTLEGKASTVHAHAAGDVISGTLDEARIPDLSATYAVAAHSHDDLYYTENEVDTLISGKAASLTFDAAVFVAKVGSDSNTGLRIDQPKLTIGAAITAASTLISGGATGVRVTVLDGGTYTENITVPAQVAVDAKGATLVGTAGISSTGELFLDRHFATANNQSMLSLDDAASGPAIYWCNVSDGRGLAGTLTGVSNVRNVGGGGKNLFARVGILYVGESGTGVGDVSVGNAGHIHLEILDLYLAGNNAVGILGASQGAGSSNIVGWIDHILEIGTPTGTVGISMTAAGAVVKLTASEIVADTAYSITAGSLYLACPKITGTRTGTPTNRMLGTEDVGTTAGTVAAGDHTHTLSQQGRAFGFGVNGTAATGAIAVYHLVDVARVAKRITITAASGTGTGQVEISTNGGVDWSTVDSIELASGVTASDTVADVALASGAILRLNVTAATSLTNPVVTLYTETA